MHLHRSPLISALGSTRCTRGRICSAVYAPPSSACAATELDLLQRSSLVVPDTQETLELRAARVAPLYRPRAATVSANVLNNIVASESLGLRPYENAINAALNYDRCRDLPLEERAQCKLDKSLVNVGALFAQEVEGRVSTQVEPRFANDTDKLVAKVDKLLQLYKESQVPTDKLIFRLPGTWAGIQAAKKLEARGIATQVFLVFSMVQAVAAAQAGVSVVQPSVGRIREFYRKFPNMLRDPRGPRQDAGSVAISDPGVAMVQQMYNYVKKYHPKTQIMATGIRSKEDVAALSGCDILLVPTKVLSELASIPTTFGYNDGISLAKSEDDLAGPTLSPKAAQGMNIEEMPVIDQAMFESGLDMAASELLKQGLKQQVDDAERLLPFFEKSTTASSQF